MKKLHTGVALSLLVSVLISCNPRAKAANQGLEDEVRKSLDSSTFDISKFDDHTIVLTASDAGRDFLTRDDINKLVSETKKKGQSWKVSELKILDEQASADSRYASVTYRVSWNILGGTKTKANLLSHEIWERQVDGWHRLFAATDE